MTTTMVIAVGEVGDDDVDCDDDDDDDGDDDDDDDYDDRNFVGVFGLA